MAEFSSNQILQIAVEAVVAPRTVRRYLAGETVNDNNRTRIRQALRKLKFEDPNDG